MSWRSGKAHDGGGAIALKPLDDMWKIVLSESDDHSDESNQRRRWFAKRKAETSNSDGDSYGSKGAFAADRYYEDSLTNQVERAFDNFFYEPPGGEPEEKRCFPWGKKSSATHEDYQERDKLNKGGLLIFAPPAPSTPPRPRMGPRRGWFNPSARRGVPESIFYPDNRDSGITTKASK